MELTISLNDPGMSALHQVGLAGLCMTLQSFEMINETIGGLNWSFSSNEIKMQWQDERIRESFEELLQKSFWIDDSGFIRLTGLERFREPSNEQKHQLYKALLNSFLQFGPHRPTGKKTTLSYIVGDDQTKVCFIRDFAPILEFRHQKATDDFIDDQGRFRASVEATGWLYPGGGQRHVAYPNTKLNEPLRHALALLYAPVGSIYYVIKSNLRGRKARLALLLPQVYDLLAYSELRSAMANAGSLSTTATSASDAVLSMLVNLTAHQDTKPFALYRENFACRVITFGIVSWNEKQKSRTNVRSVFSGRIPRFDDYCKADALFKNGWRTVPAKLDRKGNISEPERAFVAVSTARELIAENVANGRAWFSGLSDFMNNKDIRQRIGYEREELNQMVEATIGDERDRRFISACQESWRRRLGKLSSRVQSGESSFPALVKREAERLRTSLTRCRNAETLRETIVDFWARAGMNTQLRGEGLVDIVHLFDESNWRRARDLALLALISYQPQSPEEDHALTSETHYEGDEDE